MREAMTWKINRQQGAVSVFFCMTSNPGKKVHQEYTVLSTVFQSFTYLLLFFVTTCSCYLVFFFLFCTAISILFINFVSSHYRQLWYLNWLYIVALFIFEFWVFSKFFHIHFILFVFLLILLLKNACQFFSFFLFQSWLV